MHSHILRERYFILMDKEILGGKKKEKRGSPLSTSGMTLFTMCADSCISPIKVLYDMLVNYLSLLLFDLHQRMIAIYKSIQIVWRVRICFCTGFKTHGWIAMNYHCFRWGKGHHSRAYNAKFGPDIPEVLIWSNVKLQHQ